MLPGANIRFVGIHPLAFGLLCSTGAGLWVGGFKLLAAACQATAAIIGGR